MKRTIKIFLTAIATAILAFTIFSCGEKAPQGYEIGEIKGSTFTSSWAGISFSIPDELNVLSRQDTDILMGINKDSAETDPASFDTVYELYGTTPEGGMVIINTFKNIDAAAKIAEMKTEFDGKQNDMLKPSYTEETTATYGGMEFTRFDVTASAPDFVMYQTYLFKNVDEHLFCVSVAAFEEKRVEELLGGIAKQ